MCGRCRCTLDPQDVSRACGFAHSLPILRPECYHPSYNVSPGSYLPVVHKDHESDEIVVNCMKWGLVPSFTKQTEKPDHFRMFNARSESIREKVSFRRLIPNKRCLVAAEGFYEWKNAGAKKQPGVPLHLYHFDYTLFVIIGMAARYDDGQFTFIVCLANIYFGLWSSTIWIWVWGATHAQNLRHGDMTKDRMPVIFGDCQRKEAWLNSTDSDKLVSMLQPYDDSDLVWYPVTTMMGKPSFNGPECIKEISPKHDQQAAISTFFSKNKLESMSDEPQSKFSPKDSFGKEDIEENVGSENKMSALDHGASKAANDAGKCSMKRDFEQFFVESDNSESKVVPYPDPLHGSDTTRKKLGSSNKRKGGEKNHVHNQQTLHSYFVRR